MSSYSHSISVIRAFGDDIYRLSWTVDHHYPDSRLRFPRRHSRDTDKRGAERFAKKHGITMPKPKEPPHER